MDTSRTPQCPLHAPTTGAVVAPAAQPEGVWPPGPAALWPGWALLGVMQRDPLGTFSQWQRVFGDVVHLRIWPEHVVVLNDPALVRELLVTHHDALVRWERGIRVFSLLQGHSVLIAEGQAWRDKRKALLPSFARKNVQAFVPAISAACQQALAQWPDSATRWPLEQGLTSLTMDVILRKLFSSSIGSEARTIEAALHYLLLQANGAFYAPASWPIWMPWKHKMRHAMAAVHSLIDRHLQTRLNTPRIEWPEDMLTRLLDLHAQDPAAWTLQAVHDECVTAFAAGHETIAATLTWWAWCMASHPEAQTKARQEVQTQLQGRAPEESDLPALTYLGQTLSESMRLYSAAPMLVTRRCTRPLTLGHWTFPKGTLFTLPTQLQQRDARYFPEPDLFRPERFASDAPEFPRGAYLPFGAGPRVCLGQQLAETEMTVIAALLLQRYTLSVPQGMEEPRAVLNVSLRPERALHLDLIAYSFKAATTE